MARRTTPHDRGRRLHCLQFPRRVESCAKHGALVSSWSPEAFFFGFVSPDATPLGDRRLSCLAVARKRCARSSKLVDRLRRSAVHRCARLTRVTRATTAPTASASGTAPVRLQKSGIPILTRNHFCTARSRKSLSGPRISDSSKGRDIRQDRLSSIPSIFPALHHHQHALLHHFKFKINMFLQKIPSGAGNP